MDFHFLRSDKIGCLLGGESKSDYTEKHGEKV